jgi:hypothetical protein
VAYRDNKVILFWLASKRVALWPSTSALPFSSVYRFIQCYTTKWSETSASYGLPTVSWRLSGNVATINQYINQDTRLWGYRQWYLDLVTPLTWPANSSDSLFVTSFCTAPKVLLILKNKVNIANLIVTRNLIKGRSFSRVFSVIPLGIPKALCIIPYSTSPEAPSLASCTLA